MRALAFLLVAGCPGPEPDPCEDAPTVTWETFGQGFVLENCQPCHGAEGDERHGAPASADFGTEAAVLDRAAEILDRVEATDARRMPPAGGIAVDDLDRLAIWLTCDPR